MQWLGWLPKPCHRPVAGGFSLAELLISLAILGVLATWTIPKILYSQQEQQKKAVLKETISSIQAIINTGLITGQLKGGDSTYNYLTTNINVAKLCPNNANTDGCWNYLHFDGHSADPGFTLPNGAVVNGFQNVPGNNPAPGQWGSYFYIDWNGAQGPNLEGQDQLAVTFSYGTATFQNYYGWGTIRPGEMLGAPNHGPSVVMYNNLW